MSILSNAKTVSEQPLDEVYVIYGAQGTGKTVLASTFPKTKEKPMLYIDILENGVGSIAYSERENIVVVPVSSIDQLEEVLGDVQRGYTIDDDGTQINVSFSTIVLDTATQIEYLMKNQIMKNENKTKMNLNLWGLTKDSHEQLWNLCKQLHVLTGAKIVVICHQKEINDEENPGNNKIIPSLMNSAAYLLCAKASFVFYTKIENETSINPATNEVDVVHNYVTYIDGYQGYLSKTRKPVEISIPTKVKNLTYAKFNKNILDKIRGGK